MNFFKTRHSYANVHDYIEVEKHNMDKIYHPQNIYKKKSLLFKFMVIALS